jgi:hypothetical protein
MGLLRNIQKHFEKTESLNLKRTHKTTHARLREIEKTIKEPQDRLGPFRELKADVDKIFELHDVEVKLASAKPNKELDGWTAGLSIPAVGVMAYGFLSLMDGTSIPLLASTSIISTMFAATGVAALGLITIGRFAIRRHRAVHLGLTASDVKHAIRLKHTQAKLERHINKIDVMPDLREHLDSIHAKYNKSSEKKKRVKEARQPAPSWNRFEDPGM